MSSKFAVGISKNVDLGLATRLLLPTSTSQIHWLSNFLDNLYNTTLLLDFCHVFIKHPLYKQFGFHRSSSISNFCSGAFSFGIIPTFQLLCKIYSPGFST